MTDLDCTKKRPEAPATNSPPPVERRTSAFKFAFFWFVLPTIVLVSVTMLHHHHA